MMGYLCRISFVFLVFLCVKEAKAAENQTCSCDGGCDPNQECDPDSNCNKVNVAYGKRAHMDSRYGTVPRIAGKACVAVNGRTGHEMKFMNDSEPNCVHSNGSDPDAVWQVDLVQNYTIPGITIYNRAKFVERLSGLQIYIDENLCFGFPRIIGYGTICGDGLIVPVVCYTPQRGRVVKLFKTGSPHPYHAFLNFCAIQIWGCADTYHGAACSEKCRHCHNGTGCGDKTEHCPSGCLAGYQPPLCTNECSNRTYGQNCSQPCGFCKNNAPCDILTGKCNDGCSAPYEGTLCASHRANEGITSSLAGVVCGAVAIFLFGVVLGLGGRAILSTLRRRCTSTSSDQEELSVTTMRQQATSNAEEGQAKVAKPSTVDVEVPEAERSIYEGLQYRANDESLYDDPVFAKRGNKGE
uniref:Fucolectin-related molecule n=1 Tax=Littorina littorea TaxID=31216 RepID=A0A0A7RRG4_LITLI|nr:fucolectin-related protein [Littorina littorea]AJA37887.1 fucolectin-related molecule [Littorina littorea]